MSSKPALAENCCKEDTLPQTGMLDIFLKQQAYLKRIIAGMGFNSSDTEDILQDVSIKALKNNNRAVLKGKPVGWLIKVTVKSCLSEHRKRKSLLKKAKALFEKNQRTESTIDAPYKKAVNTEEKLILHHALQQLDKKSLTAIVLKYFCDMNAAQISEILDITPSAVRNRISRARQELAEKLAKRGVRP